MNKKYVIKVASIMLVLLIFNACSSSKKSGLKNMVARMQVKSPIDGVCDNNNVFVIFPIPGNAQQKALPLISFEEMAIVLNEKLNFLKDNPTYTAKGTVDIVINCNGELVQCQANNKEFDEQLNKQLKELISEFKKWKPATIQNKKVDSFQFISIEIKQGKVVLGGL